MTREDESRNRDQKPEAPATKRVAETPPESNGPALDRRQFLGGAAGATAGVMAGGVAGLTALSAGAEELSPDSAVNRRNSAFQLRHDLAVREQQRPIAPVSFNGDEALYADRNYIGNYSKGLPHDPVTGEVDSAAYEALLDAIETGTQSAFAAVPQAGTFNLLNPIGGLGFNLVGPDTRALPAPPPPALASAELAAQAAELYWMAVLRDVSFLDYGTDPLVAQACADLSAMPGYTGPRSAGGAGPVTPQELFRVDFPGVLDGPPVSQFLMFGYVQDAILVAETKLLTPRPGEDFITDYQEWIDCRNGFPGGNPGFSGAFDPVRRFPRAARDLGQIAGQDQIYSAYFRTALVLAGLFGPFRDQNLPYPNNGTFGFATLGFADFLSDLGAASQGERVTWYSKWNLHRFIRPEEYGGLVHRVLADNADYPIHPSLLNSPVLPLVFNQNMARNAARGLGANNGTYLLSQMFRSGCPTHPSYPAGHAYSAGACVTVLKAWLNEDIIFPLTRIPTADGTAFTQSGGQFTIGGELNKLAYNLTFGRDMSGFHWRADDVAGLLQGEEWSINFLVEKANTYPEDFEGFELTKFDGSKIVITANGPVPA